VFPAGDYRIGIESHADRSARLIVLATATEPERTFALPPPPNERRKPTWVSVEAAADEPAAPVTIETAPSEASEARIVFDQQPGVTTYVDCCGIGVAGRAYAVASVDGTGPTYLVRLDPARARRGRALPASGSERVVRGRRRRERRRREGRVRIAGRFGRVARPSSTRAWKMATNN
jgi:hypothetical protein